MDTITLDEALFLFTLPRVVGNDKNGDEIKANIEEDLVHIYK